MTDPKAPTGQADVIAEAQRLANNVQGAVRAECSKYAEHMANPYDQDIESAYLASMVRVRESNAALMAHISKIAAWTAGEAPKVPAGTDAEIMAIAGQWFVTGENLHKPDGYYYRSLGTPSNVRGSDLIEFGRAMIAASGSPVTAGLQEGGKNG